MNMNATNTSCYYAKDMDLNAVLLLDKITVHFLVKTNRKKTFNFQKTEIHK